MPASGPMRPPTPISRPSRGSTAVPASRPLEAEIADLEGDVEALQSRRERRHQPLHPFRQHRRRRCSTVSSRRRSRSRSLRCSEVISDSSADDFDGSTRSTPTSPTSGRSSPTSRTRPSKERANSASLQDQATAEVEHLKEVEAERLQDEAVRKALNAEEARRKRDADRKKLLKAPTPSCRRRATRHGRSTTSDAGDATDNGGDSGDVAAPTARHTPSLPAPAVARPAAAAPAASRRRRQRLRRSRLGVSHRQRAGGVRRHLGCAAQRRPAAPGRRHDRPIGIPMLAVVDGFAEPKSNTLGGTTIWFTGVDGNKYYYAHLDHYGKLGRGQRRRRHRLHGPDRQRQFSIAAPPLRDPPRRRRGGQPVPHRARPTAHSVRGRAHRQGCTDGRPRLARRRARARRRSPI